jgi:hypothetical protein
MRGEKRFFFKKKPAPARRQPKTFDPWHARRANRHGQGAKVFCFFFFKKEVLPTASWYKPSWNPPHRVIVC